MSKSEQQKNILEWAENKVVKKIEAHYLIGEAEIFFTDGSRLCINVNRLNELSFAGYDPI